MYHVNRLIHHPTDPAEPLREKPKATYLHTDPDGRKVFRAERPVDVLDLIDDNGRTRIVQNFATLDPGNVIDVIAR